MRVEIEDFQTGWYELTIGVNKKDIEKLIELLNNIKNNNNEHFHISSDYKAQGGVGDIEIYIQNEEEANNMTLQT